MSLTQPSTTGSNVKSGDFGLSNESAKERSAESNSHKPAEVKHKPFGKGGAKGRPS